MPTITIGSMAELSAELDRRGIYGYTRSTIMNRYLMDKAMQRQIPLSGSFELTPLCNLDCKMCYVHLSANQLPTGTKLLTVEQWKEIIRQAVDAGMMLADVTGGECLTYPGFKEIYRYLVDCGVRVNVLTNGRLLTDDMVAIFKKMPPSVIRVTIYGSDENAYERVTGHRAFAEVMTGIERVKRAGLEYQLSITPSRYTAPDAEKLVRYVAAQGVTYTLGEPTLAAREETGRHREDYVVDLDTYVAMKKTMNDLYKDVQPAEWVEPTLYQPPVDPEALPRRGGELPCGAGVSSFHVNWKGELMACVPFPEVHSSILDNGFQAALAEVRERLSAFRLPTECKTCEMRVSCKPCPGEMTNGTLCGELNQSVCQRVRRLIEEGLLSQSSAGESKAKG